MSWTEHRKKTPAELRKYGLVMSAAVAAVSALLFLRGSGVWIYTASAGVLFLLAALAAPRILAPVEKVWMLFAGVLGFVMTNVLLTLVFFLAVVPTGFIMRLAGKDPLSMSFDPEGDSYWIDIEKHGPGSRPEKPY